MSLPLTHLRCAKTIQRFYKTYIKAERDPQTGLPIDPISRDVIHKERQLKLFITANGIVRRIQYFDIYNLDTWFLSRGEPVNPMTNTGFTRRQLVDIRKCYIRVGLLVPNILEYNYQLPEDEDILVEDEEQEEQQEDNLHFQNNIILEHLIHMCANPVDIDEFRDILYNNTHNDTFNLNHIINIGNPSLSTGTALMNSVLNDNIMAVEELLYFNIDLNIIDSLYGYKAVDLAIISDKDNSLPILKMLLFHGARLDIPTNYGYSYELTNDIDKLEIIYTFLHTV